MAESSALVWIAGVSGGIGRALAASVPWADARVIGISRSAAADAGEHVAADLADPSAWERVGACFRERTAGFTGERVVFLNAAGALDPIGFAGEVDDDAYRANVLLNSAAPQVLGHLFLAAVRDLDAARHLVIITSGAASSIYPGWASYGAAKAGVNQWVRDAGAEQAIRGGVQVLAVAPGTVDTGMQQQLREAPASAFPQRQKFVDLHAAGKLTPAEDAARGIWSLFDRDLANGSVVDLREL